MSEEENDDNEDLENEREKINNLGVGSTWELLIGKKKKEE